MRKSILKENIEQNENINQTTEAIIKIIVDKIINLSVKKSYSNKINSELGNYCFNFMKDSISSMFELYYITHTNEQIKNKSKINNINNKNELLFKTKHPKNNTWAEISEPVNLGTDRYEGCNINYKELRPHEEEQNVNKQTNQNNIKTKTSPTKSTFANIHNSYLSKKSSKKIDLIDIKESNKNLLIPNNLNNIKENNNPNDNNNILQNNNNIQNKNKKNQIIDFPCEDIPNLNEETSIKYDLPNVDLLRKEYEKELLKKEEDKKKQKREKEKEVIQLKFMNDNNNKKIIDSNKLTFDSDGQIISFKQYRTDNLKDFLIPRNFIREVKKNNISNPSQKNKSNSDNNAATSGKTPKKNIQIIEDIIKNETINQDQNKVNNKVFEKIIPSGSNYQIMSPEIGVTIKENGQWKEGPKDFSKYFKKYSLQDYDEMLNEHLPSLNKNFLRTSLAYMSGTKSLRNSVLNTNNISNNKMSNSKKRNSNDLNNIINNNEEMSSYNPLITSPNNETNLLDKDINNLYNYKTIDVSSNNMISSKKSIFNISRNNPLLTSYNNNMNSIKLNTTNFDKFITMKKNNIGSLKLELDSLKDLTESNSGLYKNMNTLTTRYNDFIGDKFRLKNHSLISRKTNYKNYFGDFNKKILTNKRWGNEFSQNNTNNINTVYSKHQTKMQILRELGNNILNGNKVKLPRNRKVDLITSNNF